jgi:superfamily II DNA or RNA helicase
MKIEDREYQNNAIEGLRQGFREGHKRQVLSASTGAGKSIIMLQMIKAAKDKGSKIVFICERRVLVEQFSKHLDAHGIEHGVLMAKHWRYRPDAQVQVATAQTLERMETWPAFDICFIDEVHVALRASVKRLLNTRKELKVINPELGHYFTSVTSVITMRELVERKYLVPYRVFVASEIDTTGVKIVAGEFKKDELEARGQQIVGDIVADYIRISNEVWGKYRKTICFSCGIAHGAELAQKFNEAGINAVQISSNDEDEYRAEVLADFAKPDSDIKIVISVAILTRGFDQPDVKHVILARPLKKSFSEHVQMMGRVARPFGDDEFAVVQDNSGNFLRFQDSWNKLYNEGVNTLTGDEDKKPRTEPTGKEKEASKCPRCGHLWGGGDTCGHCGHVRVRRADVVSVAGVMREIKVEDKKPQVDQVDYFAQLLGYEIERGKKPGFAWYMYQKKFNSTPPDIRPAPKQPTAAVASWVTSRNIAYAKGMAKGGRA